MIRRAGPGDMETVFDIRASVFIEEQGVPHDIERDGRDGEALHLIAFSEEQAVGTARILISEGVGKIGRVAVLQSHRGTGLGKGLILAALTALREEGAHTAKLGAQTHAIGFYEALGFTARGPEFLDADIPHREMVQGL
ncbi:MAG: GNAT family N-acetyltransferase [Silicimonas sp.]|nr:GNAT family N-acetyltransferase [Silicimonas sp.]